MTNKKFNLGPFNIQIEKVEKPKYEKPRPVEQMEQPQSPPTARVRLTPDEYLRALGVEEKSKPVERPAEPVKPPIYEKNWADWLYENKIKVAAVLSSVFFVATIFGYALSSYMIHSAYQEHIQHKIQTSIDRK